MWLRYVVTSLVDSLYRSIQGRDGLTRGPIRKRPGSNGGGSVKGLSVTCIQAMPREEQCCCKMCRTLEVYGLMSSLSNHHYFSNPAPPTPTAMMLPRSTLLRRTGLLRPLAPSSTARSMTAAAGGGWEKSYEFILAEKKDKVALLTLNRPKALNALCNGIIRDLIEATTYIARDDSVGAIVLTGSTKAFAAGADIKEMKDKTFVEAFSTNMFEEWGQIARVAKPIVAAVNGYALGGGCELMMMADIVVAGENAKFGQPEITLGVIPGCGGTQRLVRAIGKSKAMELVLTGGMIDAKQAEKDGLVSKVVPTETTVDVALEMANKIASFSLPVAAAAKETVNAAFELNLAEGLRFERRIFHSLFALQDQKEGMGAFVEKRKPKFTNT